MQSRTQYMIFLMLWAGAMLVLFIAAVASGLVVRDARAPLVVCGVLALIPAAGGYVLVLRCASMLDRRRLKRGRNVYRERDYEDDAGFVHLNEVPLSERQEEISVGEMVSGMGPLLDSMEERDDSE